MQVQAMHVIGRSIALAVFAASVVLAAPATAQTPVPPAPKSVKAEETAIVLIDFQGNFVSPDGAWYAKYKDYFEKTKMLDKTVDLVKQARASGAWVVHVTEGYTQDYRELDHTNPGGFHRGQLARQAWKIGSKEAAYYAPLLPGQGDKDLVLPPRIQINGFGGTGLNEILRSKGIKNVAIAGFTSDVCVLATAISAYDLGYHVYMLKDLAPGFFTEMAEEMVRSIYPMWSSVKTSEEFVAMWEPKKVEAK